MERREQLARIIGHFVGEWDYLFADKQDYVRNYRAQPQKYQNVGLYQTDLLQAADAVIEFFAETVPVPCPQIKDERLGHLIAQYEYLDILTCGILFEAHAVAPRREDYTSDAVYQDAVKNHESYIALLVSARLHVTQHMAALLLTGTRPAG